MKNILAFAIVFVVLTVVFYNWIETPIVQFSWASGDCVSVIGGGNCENLPRKYISEWIK